MDVAAPMQWNVRELRMGVNHGQWTKSFERHTRTAIEGRSSVVARATTDEAFKPEATSLSM
jgi:hypothetical protein